MWNKKIYKKILKKELEKKKKNIQKRYKKIVTEINQNTLYETKKRFQKIKEIKKGKRKNNTRIVGIKTKTKRDETWKFKDDKNLRNKELN